MPWVLMCSTKLCWSKRHWCLNKKKWHHHRVVLQMLTRMRMGSCKCSQRCIRAAGTCTGISCGLERTMAHRPRTPIQHETPSSNIDHTSTPTTMSLNKILRWCDIVAIDSAHVIRFAHRTKLVLIIKQYLLGNQWQRSLTRSSRVIGMKPHWKRPARVTDATVRTSSCSSERCLRTSWRIRGAKQRIVNRWPKIKYWINSIAARRARHLPLRLI